MSQGKPEPVRASLIWIKRHDGWKVPLSNINDGADNQPAEASSLARHSSVVVGEALGFKHVALKLSGPCA